MVLHVEILFIYVAKNGRLHPEALERVTKFECGLEPEYMVYFKALITKRYR
jgi:hypothetical protein